MKLLQSIRSLLDATVSSRKQREFAGIYPGRTQRGISTLHFIMGTNVPQILIPVYRMNQPSLVSPCVLGDPCPTCKLHQKCMVGICCGSCRRGLPVECERQASAPPAFTVAVAEALRMLNNGEAICIHRNTALRLTYPRPAHLRDQSCKVDPGVMFQYVSGSFRARLAVDIGWQSPPETTALAPSQQHSAMLGFA